MPKIFEIGAQSTRNAGNAPLPDAHAKDQEFAAKARLGQAIAGAGEFFENYALQKQDLINRGQLAELEGKRMDLEASIQNMIEDNASEPGVWDEQRNALIDQYQSEREKDLAKASPIVRDTDELKYQDWLNRNRVSFSVQLNRGFINSANAQIEALAQQYLRNGDYDRFKAAMQELNVTDEQRDRMLRRGLDEGLYNLGDLQIQNLNDTESLEQYIDWIQEKDEAGNYVNMEFEDGGISYGARTQLVRLANYKILQIERRKLATEQSLLPDIAKGLVGQRDIEKLEAQGQITPEFAEFQKNLLELKSEAQTATKDIEGDKTTYKLIQDMMAPNWVQAILGQTPELSDRQYRHIYQSIENSGLLRDTKLDLARQLLQLKTADLDDGEEETDNWRDRKIGPVERGVRQELLENYRQLLPDLGVITTGLMMQKHEQLLREYFESNPKATPEEAMLWFRGQVKNPMLMQALATRSEAAVDLSE